MKEALNKTGSPATDTCARAEDLIAYLYGEAPQSEAKDFEKHMGRCASCRAELAAFGDVREAIGEWRVEALGRITSPAFEARAEATSEFTNQARTKRGSAFAAIRQFFALSPAWMRAATAATALVFCALAVIAVAYFMQQPKTVVVKSGYSVEEVNAKVAAAIEKQKSEKVTEAPLPSPQQITVALTQPTVHPQTKRGNPQVAANKIKRQFIPRTTTNPSTELVRADDYLPFTASRDEEKLPSLSDLVNDDN